MTPARLVGLAVAVLMILVGGTWFAQGNGWLGGSGADDTARAYLGALTAGLGVALTIVIAQRGRAS